MSKRRGRIVGSLFDVSCWPEASVRCIAAIRPESGVKPTCQDSSTDAVDPDSDLVVGDCTGHVAPRWTIMSGKALRALLWTLRVGCKASASNNTRQYCARTRLTRASLPDLTEDHLRELGFPLGARLKILKAIGTLYADKALALQPDATAKPSPQITSHEHRAERRQVTVMFSDLVGSTALSARMDPEDLREVLSTYQRCVAETVQRFGGFVAKYMGDGVLIYFGYPQAHEDDAERAVRAGLELAAAVGALKTHAPLQTRVGIATGLVVVGDLIGSGASHEQAIVGETPNLAARLQGIAEPNEVVIAEDTRKLIGHLFDLEDLGATDLKGIAGPVLVRWYCARLLWRAVSMLFTQAVSQSLSDAKKKLNSFCAVGQKRKAAKVKWFCSQVNRA